MCSAVQQLGYGYYTTFDYSIYIVTWYIVKFLLAFEQGLLIGLLGEVDDASHWPAG